MGCTCSKCDCSTCCCCCCEDDLVPQQQQLSSYHEHPMPTNKKILKSMPQGPAAIERMKKFGITTRNVSKLIDGYQNETVTSLEDALKFFNRKLVYLPESIKKAKEKCNRKKYNLTHDESAAIYLYSMARKPTSFFDELQRAFDSGERAQLLPWFKYLKLLKNAYDKLPYAKSEILQGGEISGKLEESITSNAKPDSFHFGSHSKPDSSSFSSQSKLYYSSLGSASLSIAEINTNLLGPGTFLSYETLSGKDISDFTEGNIREFLIWPGTKLSIAKIMKQQADGSLVMHLTSKLPLPKPIDEVLEPERHFVCQNNNCRYACRGNHKTNHCYGFASIDQKCEHHCVHINECLICGDNESKLRECNQCKHCFCDRCCLQYL